MSSDQENSETPGESEGPAAQGPTIIDSAFNEVVVELSVVLGRSVMPIEHLLRMGRGAIIELETLVDDDVWILANNRPVARGQVTMSGDRLAVIITHQVAAGSHAH